MWVWYNFNSNEDEVESLSDPGIVPATRSVTSNKEYSFFDFYIFLESLLQLEKIVVTFNSGQTTMNFAEAALLIQGSACVYSKKVI